jgi:hypothetical protein
VSNVEPLFGTHLPSKAGQPRESLVELLTNILERAKSGELQSFIGCGFTKDGLRLAVWHATHENVYEMLGSLAWLQHEYVHREVRKVDGNGDQHP